MTTETHSTWEQKSLEKLLMASLSEQRQRRRWGIFFKSLYIILLVLIVYLLWPSDNLPNPNKVKNHIALIDIRGEIDSSAAASADNIIEGLHQAFKDKQTQAVILRIDSPGGSPVQATNIYTEIRYMRHKYPNTKLYAVCSDSCASAAYYIAAAGDNIYASPASLVGSIGVLLNGFGFVDAMQKIGVERRLLIAGQHKAFLDPFSPLKPDEQKDAQSLLDDVHQQFIHNVQLGRGARLKNDPDIFSGLVWTGQQALPLGLIDGLGDMQSVARDVIKNENIVDYTVKPSFLDQVTNHIGASFAGKIASELGVTQRTLH